MVDNLGEVSQRQRKNKLNTLHGSTILRALYEIADLIFMTAPEILFYQVKESCIWPA
jgi:hypothetical protein